MFESVLIANRGEIACRIIRTCRRLGVRSVAVYSDADREARHVREADDAVYLGPSDASRSYLDAAALIAVAKASGASAIHPGYGFLSEKPVLARACVENGLIWVGPRAQVIEQMGSKTEAKKIAERAGVALVPGYHGDDASPEALFERAREIGFPVLIKASAGGGGKGMRRVEHEADFLPQLALAKQEALRAFGDDRILLERLIQRPRHLEVQVAGDHHGNLIHLFERECSVQRNYQKVIEEAPAAWLSERTRELLYTYALRLAREIRYDSLGTLEFVLDANSEEPYFLEMNTRLQVEHPVTEQVTGLDLVEMQLRIAAGEVLPVAQTDLRCTGWAIEARINCEDPMRDYRPELGTIVHYGEALAEGVRIDSGVTAGATVTPYYDSMIAKVIGFAPTRAAAVRRLLAGLGGFETLGVGTSQAFVRDIIRHPNFLDRPLTTRYIDDTFPLGWKVDARVHDIALAVAGFCELHQWQARVLSGLNPWFAADGYRNVRGDRGQEAGQDGERDAGQGAARLMVETDGALVSLKLSRDNNDWHVLVNERRLTLQLGFDGNAHVRVNEAGFAPLVIGFFCDNEGARFVSWQGVRWQTNVLSERDHRAAASRGVTEQGGAVRAALPGLITAVHVVQGQAVTAGEVVAVMEAMKLVFSLEAPITGRVEAVLCELGQSVSNAQLLLEIVANEA
jgi:3-methylcrotonyl-CoA carboxylase alpha subunit